MNYTNDRQREGWERKGGSQTDKNLMFFSIIDSKYEQQRVKDMRRFKEMIEAIKQHLNKLSTAEKQQWARYIELKCIQLSKNSRIAEFKQHIRRLTHICNSLKIQYNKDFVSTLIKSVYYEKYGEQMLPFFIKAGYNIEEYQVLNYSQPWYSKVFNFFSSD